jgi:hypothetical protein
MYYISVKLDGTIHSLTRTMCGVININNKFDNDVTLSVPTIRIYYLFTGSPRTQLKHFVVHLIFVQNKKL